MCVYLFLLKKSYPCGLIKDCAFICFSQNFFSKNLQICLQSSRPALICISEYRNDLFWGNFNNYVVISSLWVYFTLHSFQPCALIRACAFICKGIIFRPVHLFGSVRLLGSPKYIKIGLSKLFFRM